MKNRNMFYQNINQGYNNPGTIIPPSGYNINTQYQSYGPNVMQNPYQNNIQEQYNNPNTINTNEYEEKFSKIERQLKNLDTRVQKLENNNFEKQEENFYMI